MTVLPEPVSEAWDDRKGPAILSTVDGKGMPNTIYVGCLSKFDDNTVLIADNYFDKTRKNIHAGCKGSLLFMTNGGKAYQIKGEMQYHTEGELFEDMREWNPSKHPGHAAAALLVEEVYSGAEKLA